MSAFAYSTAAVFGSTGLVGSFILPTLLATPSLQTTTISRRAPKPATASPAPSNLNAVIETDTAAWAPKLPSLSPPPHTVFSAVGTTRAAAGGIANQWKIDHDLNIEIAKAAKAAGAKTYVFISSAGTRGLMASFAPYSKMKVGVEEAIRGLGFDNAIILRPGLILGTREESRLAEGLAHSAVHGLGRLSQAAKDSIGQDASEIGRAAVVASEIAAEGKAPEKFWVLEGADIIRLGRTEWKERHGSADADAEATK
ncbi:hypothetical protein F5X68DRAFT_212735 [Plectosphaerella plurivora]|uniref:NAD-dependent epimerase/dehydratase domain-containing protein n=1 Tax=Plectosphaerella plurivora TaxID=936078 RepID=A0A9P9A9J3_9PEZI|nr:hypothetical protein F5X68DRAFT_212735 [Plectosphaerella plurivora]